MKSAEIYIPLRWFEKHDLGQRVESIYQHTNCLAVLENQVIRFRHPSTLPTRPLRALPRKGRA